MFVAIKQILLNSYKAFISLVKKTLRIDKLNNKEISGYLNKFTSLKLAKHSTIDIPFHLGRTIRGVSFSHSFFKDPFALFCKRCAVGEPDEDLINYLYSLYQFETESSAADIVGFKENHILGRFPAWSIVMPWEKISLEVKYKTYLKSFIKNRQEHGVNYDNYGLVDSDKVFYDRENARSQVFQTKKLWKSISSRGVLSLKPLPRVFILIDKDRWRWVMSGSGNHRAYLSRVLESKTLFVEVCGVINKAESSLWHNVKNGIYSESEAVALFDSFFDGREIRRGMV